MIWETIDILIMKQLKSKVLKNVWFKKKKKKKKKKNLLQIILKRHLAAISVIKNLQIGSIHAGFY